MGFESPATLRRRSTQSAQTGKFSSGAWGPASNFWSRRLSTHTRHQLKRESIKLAAKPLSSNFRGRLVLVWVVSKSVDKLSRFEVEFDPRAVIEPETELLL